MTNEPRFMVKDQSGRGFSVTLPLSDIRQRWDMEYRDDPANELESMFGDWLDTAEVGDTFTNHDDNVTFTRVD